MSDASMWICPWSEKALDQYRASVAPIRENFWNKVDKIVNGAGSLAIVVLLFVGALWIMLSPISLYTQGTGMVLVVLFILWGFLGPVCQTRKIRPPQWSTCSISNMMRNQKGTFGISPHHPLRRAIAEYRTKSTEAVGAEFEIEYLEDHKERTEYYVPKYAIVWVTLSPFTSGDKLPIMVLKDLKTIVEPSVFRKT